MLEPFHMLVMDSFFAKYLWNIIGYIAARLQYKITLHLQISSK